MGLTLVEPTNFVNCEVLKLTISKNLFNFKTLKKRRSSLKKSIGNSDVQSSDADLNKEQRDLSQAYSSKHNQRYMERLTVK